MFLYYRIRDKNINIYMKICYCILISTISKTVYMVQKFSFHWGSVYGGAMYFSCIYFYSLISLKIVYDFFFFPVSSQWERTRPRHVLNCIFCPCQNLSEENSKHCTCQSKIWLLIKRMVFLITHFHKCPQVIFHRICTQILTTLKFLANI